MAELIAELESESIMGLTAPEGAEQWSEALIREYFDSDGEMFNQPGGGLSQPAFSPPEPSMLPTDKFADMEAACQDYRERAFAAGIAFRPDGLFPRDDPLLTYLAAEPRNHPFDKHLMSPETGDQVVAPISFPVGNDAAKNRGIDLRYFFQDPNPYDTAEPLPQLVGAVRFGEKSAVGGSPFFSSAHGGAIETVLDECTAELAKCLMCPIAVTTSANFKIKKPGVLYKTYSIKCVVAKKATDYRWEIDGFLEDGDDIIASVNANLVDVTKL